MLGRRQSRVRTGSIGKRPSSETTSETDGGAPVESTNKPQACVLSQEPLQNSACIDEDAAISSCKECFKSSKERPGRQAKTITI